MLVFILRIIYLFCFFGGVGGGRVSLCNILGCPGALFVKTRLILNSQSLPLLLKYWNG